MIKKERGKKMKVILPFKYPCVVDSFSGVANNVGIYMNYPQYYTPLLIANHFLITYSFELGHGGYNWKFYNDDYGYSIDIRQTAKEEGVVETIKYYLNNNKYVRLLMDFYYIKKSPWYQNEHLLHWMPIIIGYDAEKEVFYLCDNLFNGKYEMVEVGFDEVIDARNNHENEIMECCYFDNKIDYQLSKKDLKVLIRSYLDGDCYIDKNYVTYNREDIKIQQKELFGIKVYDILIDLVNELYKSDLAYDIKTFHIMLDHIKVCNVMMNWIKEQGVFEAKNIGMMEWITVKYNELRENMIEIQNLYIKFSFTNSEKDRLSLISKISFNRKMEKCILKKLLKIL